MILQRSHFAMLEISGIRKNYETAKDNLMQSIGKPLDSDICRSPIIQLVSRNSLRIYYALMPCTVYLLDGFSRLSVMQ
jgi:hypothetical protein